MSIPALSTPPTFPQPGDTGDTFNGRAFDAWDYLAGLYAEINAVSAAYGDQIAAALSGTSATSVAIGLGAKGFTTQAGLAFKAGTSLKIASRASPANYMSGVVASYSSTALTMTIDDVGGSGTFTDWDISLTPANDNVSFAELGGVYSDNASLVSAFAGKQAAHANLTALAGLSLIADRLPYANGSGTMALATYTSFARTLDACANAAAVLSALGATTVGSALLLLSNPSAISFLRVNADNTVTARSATNFRSDLSLGSAALATAPSGNIVGDTDTQVLTNKDVNMRKVDALATSGTVTPVSGTTDIFKATGLTGGITMAAPSGSPTEGQILQLRIKDNGTSRSISWNAIYRVIGCTLPSATTISKYLYVTCEYNSADTKWDVLSVATEA